MTRQQLEDMLNDLPKRQYDEGVKAVASGLMMSSDGNEGKEDAQLHQLRWKMQDTQSQLKDLATKLKEAGKPASSGSSWDGLGELAALASKVTCFYSFALMHHLISPPSNSLQPKTQMNEEQAAFQRLTRDLLDRRFQDMEEQMRSLNWELSPNTLVDAYDSPAQLVHALPRDQLENVLLDSDNLEARLRALNALPGQCHALHLVLIEPAFLATSPFSFFFLFFLFIILHLPITSQLIWSTLVKMEMEALAASLPSARRGAKAPIVGPRSRTGFATSLRYRC